MDDEENQLESCDICGYTDIYYGLGKKEITGYNEQTEEIYLCLDCDDDYLLKL